jgi:hypothetical protein
VELLGDVESTFAAEVDIDQCHIRSQFFEASKRVSARRGHADDCDAFALQQPACGGYEMRAVIND